MQHKIGARQALEKGESTHTGDGLHDERTASSDVLAVQEGGQEGDVVTEGNS